MPRRGRRGRSRPAGRKKKKHDLDDDGEAGETVVHVQCPYCRKLFENKDDFCPFCGSDITVTPDVPDEHAVKLEGIELKYFSIYASIILTIFTGLFGLYFVLMPKDGVEFSAIGFVVLPFGVFLIILLFLLFAVLKRQRVTPGVKSKLIISALFGAFLSFLIIGIVHPGQLFIDSADQGDWAQDAAGIHNLFILLSLLFLIILVGYFFLLNYQKRKDQQQRQG